MRGQRGAAALVLSALAHAGLGSALATAFAAREVPSGSPPFAGIGLAADSVSRERVRAAAPEVRPAPAGVADLAALGRGGEIGLSAAPRSAPALEATEARDLEASDTDAFSVTAPKLNRASPFGQELRAASPLAPSLPARQPAAPPGSGIEPPTLGIVARPLRLGAAASLGSIAPKVSTAQPRLPEALATGAAESTPVAAAVPRGVHAAVSRSDPPTTRAASVVQLSATAERRFAPAIAAGVVPVRRAVIAPRAPYARGNLAAIEAESAEKAAAGRPNAAFLQADRPDTQVSVAMRVAGAAAMPPRPPPAEVVSARRASVSSAAAGPAPSLPALRQGTGGSGVTVLAPEGARVAPERPDANRATATLGWTGELGETVDPVSIRAARAFVSPASAAGGSTARDAVDYLLTGLACSRVQATFDPETGSLRLRGHVADAETGRRLATQLEMLVGNAIPLDSDLRLLPPPQCEALPLVAALGLPQSDAHTGDPAVVGPDAFVREETYRAGEHVRLDLRGPDYSAFLYVDYFDASGAVIHLLPNEHLPIGRLPSGASVRLGGSVEEGAAFSMLVAPPFHKEIAVAYAVTEPLYDGARPLSEPAAPYLRWLRDRIAEASARSPEFRGEWAYVFINTAPGGTP